MYLPYNGPRCPCCGQYMFGSPYGNHPYYPNPYYPNPIFGFSSSVTQGTASSGTGGTPIN